MPRRGERRRHSDDELQQFYDEIVKDGPEVATPQIIGVRRVFDLLERAGPAGDVHADTVLNQDTVKVFPTDEFAQEHLPQKIGRFQILESIGLGGFGIVFRAYDPNLDREIALKVPRTIAALTPESQERFRREGMVVASLSHPNIVPVYDSGNFGPVCYMACQLVGRRFTGQMD